MPANDSVLLDTSAAVAFPVADHQHHDEVFGALVTEELGLAGRAAFETFSVLTRFPAPARRRPTVVARKLEANFPATRFMSADRSTALLRDLAGNGIAGGSVYDARWSAPRQPSTASYSRAETVARMAPTGFWELRWRCSAEPGPLDSTGPALGVGGSA